MKEQKKIKKMMNMLKLQVKQNLSKIQIIN